MSCGVGRKWGSDPAMLWLWCRPAATASIEPLAWEPPYAVGAAPKRHTQKNLLLPFCQILFKYTITGAGKMAKWPK